MQSVEKMRAILLSTFTAAGVLLAAGQSHGAILASWNFNDGAPGSASGPPYANQVFASDLLNLRGGTDAAGNGPGASGAAGDYATHVQFTGPGPSTGLISANPSEVQVDSFGFSFDFNPQFLGTFDNFVGKEAVANDIGWQVHLLGDGDADNLTQMEFVVRGNNTSPTKFAAAVTPEIITLGGYDPLGDPKWTHVEGSYDSLTGEIKLSLSGAYNASVSTTGDAGAVNSAGGAIFVGTGGNGGGVGSPTAFAANTYIDNLSVVPEPASIGMIGVAAIGILFRRSRKQA